MRWLQFRSLAMLAATLGAPAGIHAAPPVKDVCAAAHLSGQELRQAGRLLEARDRLYVCAARGCPAIIQADCGRWLEEVQSSMPTVVLGARSQSGADIVDVVVRVDGREVARRLDGKPLALEPGPHTLGFQVNGQPEVRVDVLIKAGVKNREIIAELPVGEVSTAPPLAFWVLAGIGTAGLISFGTFGAIGQAEYSDLESSCAPSCSTADSDAVRTKFLVADISLGVGLAAYAGAAYFYFAESRSDDTPARRAQRSRSPHFVVSPSPGGAYLGVRGAL